MKLAFKLGLFLLGLIFMIASLLIMVLQEAQITIIGYPKRDFSLSIAQVLSCSLIVSLLVFKLKHREVMEF